MFRVNFNCLQWHWKINMSIKSKKTHTHTHRSCAEQKKANAFELFEFLLDLFNWFKAFTTNEQYDKSGRLSENYNQFKRYTTQQWNDLIEIIACILTDAEVKTDISATIFAKPFFIQRSWFLNITAQVYKKVIYFLWICSITVIWLFSNLSKRQFNIIAKLRATFEAIW